MWTCAAPLAGVKKPWLERGAMVGGVRAASGGALRRTRGAGDDGEG